METSYATMKAMATEVLTKALGNEAFSPWLAGLILLVFVTFLLNPMQRLERFLKRWNYLLAGPKLIGLGYARSAGKAFVVPGPDNDHVFISSKHHLKEVQKARKDELSFFAATRQMFQPTYTMLGHNWLDERGAEGIGYVKAVGTLLPNRLLEIMPLMRNNINETIKEFYEQHREAEGGGKIMLSYLLVKKVMCNLNGFAFFGNELAKNKHFMKMVFEYNELVVTAAEVLRVTPRPFKPLVGSFFKSRRGIQKAVFCMINDIVKRRLQERDENKPLPSDLITWIIDTAPPELNWDARRITYEIIAIWFGSVHALSATTAYALYDLCLHPEYVEPLRAELKSLDEYTRTMQGLPLLDSFIKESTRLNPMEAMSGRRQALKDFYFSDGTKVAKGSWTCVPAKAMLSDANFFPDPSNFNGFRFVSPEKMPDQLQTASQPEGPSKLTDISPHYHNWGIGQIVCPGRFYASVAMKLTLAHFLENYDCSLVDVNQGRESIWRSYILPSEHTLVRFTPTLQKHSIS